MAYVHKNDNTGMHRASTKTVTKKWHLKSNVWHAHAIRMHPRSRISSHNTSEQGARRRCRYAASELRVTQTSWSSSCRKVSYLQPRWTRENSKYARTLPGLLSRQLGIGGQPFKYLVVTMYSALRTARCLCVLS